MPHELFSFSLSLSQKHTHTHRDGWLYLTFSITIFSPIVSNKISLFPAPSNTHCCDKQSKITKSIKRTMCGPRWLIVNYANVEFIILGVQERQFLIRGTRFKS